MLALNATKATDLFLKKLEGIEYGHVRITTPDGKVREFAGKKPGAKADLTLQDWSVPVNMALRGDVGFIEDYRNKRWETSSLHDLLTFGLQNDRSVNAYLYGSTLRRALASLGYIFKSNSLRGSRRNIQAHYDLGNDFYQLWLDPSMTYSAALYTKSDDSLEQAQANKYNRILDRLESNSGTVLEVGCGWGGFADQALQKGDFAVKGITLSDQQKEYASQRLAGKADIALEDYRHQTGLYDHLVSIEMFEAVGEKFWPVYFGKMASLLKRSGHAVIQTITMAEPYFDSYRKGNDIFRSFIFPGGMLPSASRFAAEAGKAGLRVVDQFDFGKDYGRTCLEWLNAFNANENAIKALGYDERFMRLWRFYLAACIAGFNTGRINVMQADLQHA